MTRSRRTRKRVPGASAALVVNGARKLTPSRRLKVDPLHVGWSSVVGGCAGWDAAEVAVFESVAVAFEGDDFGVVDEPVDHGGGDDVVAEHFAPAAEGLVAGDDQRGSFVAGGDELEEQVRGFGFEGDVADLVDDEQRVAAEPDEFGLQAAGVVGVGEAGDPVGGGGEQRRGARLGRRGSPARSRGGSCRCRAGRGTRRSRGR